MARELISRIQNIRKESALEITDRIHVTVSPNERIGNAIAGYADYIKSQVLALNINVAENDGVEVEIDDFKLNVKIVKN